MKYQKLISICALSGLLVGCQPQFRNYIKPIALHREDIALVTAQSGLEWNSGEIHLQDGVNQLTFVVKVWRPNQQKWQETSYPVVLHKHDKEIRRFAIVHDVYQNQLRFTLEASETISQALDLEPLKQSVKQRIQVPEKINYELNTFIPMAVIGATAGEGEEVDFSQLKEISPETLVATNPKAIYYVAGFQLSGEE